MIKLFNIYIKANSTLILEYLSFTFNISNFVFFFDLFLCLLFSLRQVMMLLFFFLFIWAFTRILFYYQRRFVSCSWIKSNEILLLKYFGTLNLFIKKFCRLRWFFCRIKIYMIIISILFGTHRLRIFEFMRWNILYWILFLILLLRTTTTFLLLF